MLQAPGDLDSEGHFRKRFPNLRLSDRHKSFQSAVNGSRLILCTDNGTTFIEALYLDTPTVLYYNPKRYSLTPCGAAAIRQLELAGVVHSTPESAAYHIASIWDRPRRWWCAPETRLAVAGFLRKFGNVTEHPHRDMADVLTKVGLEFAKKD